jgi:chitodextrinase
VAGFTVQCVERLHVRTATTGPGTDPDGYLVVIDYADGTADTASAGINQTFGLAGVPPGDHLIRLVGVEPSCVAPAGVTRTVSGRDSTLVSFAVSCPAPPPPTGLQATLIETNRIDLGWTAVSGPVAKYRIYRNDLLHDSTAGTTFSDPGLTPFTTYSYRVSTVNTAGLEGARSGAVAARTLDATPPTAPGSLTATPVSGTRINLAWQAASDPETGVARYLIYRDGNSVATVNALSFADTGLSPGATHSYTVTAENGQGIEGPAGGPASATTLTGVVDLVVVASSSGPAPAGYTALIEMGGVRQSQSVDANGNVVFAALQPGSYSVVLQAVPGNCSVTAPNPRSVSLPAGAASVTTTFVVTCQ